MSTRILPVIFRWQMVEVTDGDGVVERRPAMVPEKRFAGVCKRQFHDGEDYTMAPLEPRSRASHNAYFAELNEGFNSLPEDLSEVAENLSLKTLPPDGFIDSEHFRKWALCHTGWCDVDEFDFDTPKKATDFAKFCRKQDTYAQILIRGTHVTVKVAQSQSAASMSKDPFEKSKHDVLDLLTAMLGVTRTELKKHARSA